MTLVDWVVLRRLGSRIAVTVLVMFGIIALAESLNVWRFEHFSAIGGPLLGLLAIVTGATRWSIGVLPVTVLIGAIIGLLDLQARREMTVIKATGLSIWTVLRAPIIAIAMFGVFTSLVIDTSMVLINRSLSISLPQSGGSGTLWLEQSGGDRRYVLMALHPHPGGTVLEDVTIFVTSGDSAERIHAKTAQLVPGAWRIPEGIRFQPDFPPRRIVALLSREVSDPQARNRLEMRLTRPFAMPLMLAGSLVIAFAFTAGYRRTNKYGVAVLYGVVLGFVVYVIQEMANMAGLAGVLRPVYAATGPAFVAIVIGVTVLLHKEDGRA
ncbi:MAG: LptF/LptG family permease [Hyphomicrobiales bacterium]|nr:MAG: LptF/LptG family permease [Hyphomicrobiales bacterium]